jgi:HEPN domain-containing protein
MTPLTREWVEKAEGDYNSAWLLYRARKTPSYDGACFHAQQCAEKYMKARLQEASIPFRKTHDLTRIPGIASHLIRLYPLVKTSITLEAGPVVRPG